MESHCPLGVLLNDNCSNGSSAALYILNDEKRVLLNLRTGHSVPTVCDAHRIAYLKLYAMNPKKCCDPRGIHKKRSVTPGLKVTCITVPMAQQHSTSDFKLVPEKKLCTSYQKNLIDQTVPRQP